MGVVVKRAKAFVGFSGYRPEKSKQLKLDMIQDDRTAGSPATHNVGGCSTCNAGACAGCPVAALRGTSPLMAGSVAYHFAADAKHDDVAVHSGKIGDQRRPRPGHELFQRFDVVEPARQKIGQRFG